MSLNAYSLQANQGDWVQYPLLKKPHIPLKYIYSFADLKLFFINRWCELVVDSNNLIYLSCSGEIFQLQFGHCHRCNLGLKFQQSGNPMWLTLAMRDLLQQNSPRRPPVPQVGPDTAKNLSFLKVIWLVTLASMAPWFEQPSASNGYTPSLSFKSSLQNPTTISITTGVYRIYIYRHQLMVFFHTITIPYTTLYCIYIIYIKIK